jgi:hypothetical protein
MIPIGDVEFVEGRSPRETTTAVLQNCLGSEKKAGQKQIDGFLKQLSIKPDAFFNDIDTDWLGRPFIGQHVFKVAQSAGYLGSEDDLWLAVTGSTAPYAVKGRGVPPKKVLVTKLKMAVKSRQDKLRSPRSPNAGRKPAKLAT